jgi:hypothetical protein
MVMNLGPWRFIEGRFPGGFVYFSLTGDTQ